LIIAVGGAITAVILIIAGVAIAIGGGGKGQGAAARFSPFEACEHARVLHREGKFDQAMELWRRSAWEGNATAALAMGMLNDPVLFKDRFTPLSKADPDSASKWYQGARLLGAGDAEARLADLALWKADNTLFGSGRRSPVEPADIPAQCVGSLASQSKVAELRRLFGPDLSSEVAESDKRGGRQPMPTTPGSPLFAKVLTRGSVTPFLAASEQARLAPEALRPLTMLYVYGEKEVDKRRWLELGPDTRARDTVWLPEDQLIPWNQALVLTFSPRTNRDRALLYRTEGILRDVLKSSQRPRAVAELSQRYCRNNDDAFKMVAAIEPNQEFDVQKNFYFMPIVDFKKATVDGVATNLLKVAALNLHGGASGAAVDSSQVRCDYTAALTPPGRSRPQAQPAPLAQREFRLGVAFVVDTTLSMGPYIEETKHALRQFHDAMRWSDDGRGMGFALIGFRSNLRKTPAIGYDVKVFSPLSRIQDSDDFAQALDGLQESKVSTFAFREDSLLGVDTAINDLDWSGYDAGLIVVVTDASSMERGGADRLIEDQELAGSQHNVEGLRDLADKKKLYISVAHILSAEGLAMGDRPRAQKQYKALTRSAHAGKTFYAPITADNGQSFGRDMASFLEGFRSIPRTIERGGEFNPDTKMGFFGNVADIGRPLQMRFYALTPDGPAPEVFSAWMSERNLVDSTRMDVSVRLLLTKDQLSRLYQAISVVVESAHASGTDGASFFKQMTELSAGAIIDPGKLAGRTAIRSLGDVGGVGQILERLPYRSKFLTITPQEWGTMSLGAQQDFLAELQAKLAYYKTLHDQPDMWVAVSPDSSGGERLFPMELDRLP
jgi:serine/threonine-protein kinase PpkA